MKPLELTIHPPVPPKPSDDTSLEWSLWWADRGYESSLASMKRLEDAELAAEYWRLRLKVCSRGNRDVKRVGHPCVEWRAAHDECDTLRRFATHPHYDEAES